jgi:hypothetical protein
MINHEMTPIKQKKRFNRASKDTKKVKKIFVFSNFRVFVIKSLHRRIIKCKEIKIKHLLQPNNFSLTNTLKRGKEHEIPFVAC